MLLYIKIEDIEKSSKIIQSTPEIKASILYTAVTVELVHDAYFLFSFPIHNNDNLFGTDLIWMLEGNENYLTIKMAETKYFSLLYI